MIVTCSCKYLWSASKKRHLIRDTAPAHEHTGHTHTVCVCVLMLSFSFYFDFIRFVDVWMLLLLLRTEFSSTQSLIFMDACTINLLTLEHLNNVNTKHEISPALNSNRKKKFVSTKRVSLSRSVAPRVQNLILSKLTNAVDIKHHGIDARVSMPTDVRANRKNQQKFLTARRQTTFISVKRL